MVVCVCVFVGGWLGGWVDGASEVSLVLTTSGVLALVFFFVQTRVSPRSRHFGWTSVHYHYYHYCYHYYY